MKTIRTFMGAALLLALSTGAGHAGEGYGEDVYVSSRFAHGSLTQARNSFEFYGSIGCDEQSWGNDSRFAYCWAQEPSWGNGLGYGWGAQLYCTTDDPGHLRLVESLNAASLLSFSVGPSGRCLHLRVTNASTYLPDTVCR